jgi:thiamine biosynthesis lipoprotein ApbE
MHTLKGLNRSVSQAQICEKKRGRSHGPAAGNQVGDGALVTAGAKLRSSEKSRFFVKVSIDPKTGEPVKDRSK